MDKMRIGLVGYKFMGKAHSNAFYDVAKFFDLPIQPEMTAICGRDPKGVAAAAKKWGWKSFETDWKDLVKRNDIDLVDITTPNNAHKDIVIGAANAGKHVLCEKPLALNLKDAEAMLKAVEKNKVKHAISFNYRKVPAVALARQMVKEGKIGRVFHVRAVYLQDWIIDPDFPVVWRLSKNVCGSGSLGDLAAHCIDTARYLTGDEVSDVCGMWETFIKRRPLPAEMSGLSAKKSNKMGKVDVDDATLFLAKFKQGAVATFEATRFAAGHKNALIIEINGSKGSIRFEQERMNELQYFSREDEAHVQGWRTIQVSEGMHPYWSAWWPAAHIIGYEHTFIHLVKDMVEAIADNKNPTPNFYDGLACQEVMEAVEKSIKSKRWIKV